MLYLQANRCFSNFLSYLQKEKHKMIVLDIMFNALLTIPVYFAINHDHQDTVTAVC